MEQKYTDSVYRNNSATCRKFSGRGRYMIK